MAYIGSNRLVLVSAMALALVLAGCSSDPDSQSQAPAQEEPERETIWNLFENSGDPEVTVRVNRYIWNAALEVLGFMPVESVDPFTGLIVFGWGSVPGTDAEYKATVLVGDPALDARSLSVAIVTRSGPAKAETVEAVEEAILTRARQLRMEDDKY